MVKEVRFNSKTKKVTASDRKFTRNEIDEYEELKEMGLYAAFCAEKEEKKHKNFKLEFKEWKTKKQ